MSYISSGCLFITVQRLSSRIGHQATGFKVSASFFVQLCPMAAFASGRQPLCQPSIRKPLVGRVNPPEAESFFHYFEIRQRVGLWCFGFVASHPAAFLCEMVLLKPIPQLSPFCKSQQVRYVHSSTLIVCRKTFPSVSPSGMLLEFILPLRR